METKFSWLKKWKKCGYEGVYCCIIFMHEMLIHTCCCWHIVRSARSKVIYMQNMSPPFIKQTHRTEHFAKRTARLKRSLSRFVVRKVWWRNLDRYILENSKANKYAGSINMYISQIVQCSLMPRLSLSFLF